jgi:hypothetical protein
MKPPIVILVLLIGAFVVGDFAAIRYVISTNRPWPDPPGIILLGLVFGQVMLLSQWLVFSRWNIALRVLIAISGVFGLSNVVASATQGANNINYWFAILLVAFCTATVPTTMVRLSRWQITAKGHSRDATRMTVWQFSIWGLLSGTTAVAIVLGTAKQVELAFTTVVDAVTFFVCFALTGLVVFLVGLGIQSTKLAARVTMFVASIVCPLAGMLVGVSALQERESPARWALFGFSFGATMAIAVLALRVAGYRLSRAPLAAPNLEDAVGDELGVTAAESKVVEERGMESKGVETKGVEANGADERDVTSDDEMASSKLAMKIHGPEIPDVGAPDVAPPEIVVPRPTLSIHTEPEDD